MIKLEIYNRPGKDLSEKELEKLHEEILSVAGECLDEIPRYQCLTGERKEYSRVIISLARNKEGKLLGFCSSYILEVGSRNVLHLGLTCVSPQARSLGLTHKLSSKVVKYYLLNYSLFKPAWISNVACVLSSLGNVPFISKTFILLHLKENLRRNKKRSPVISVRTTALNCISIKVQGSVISVLSLKRV